MSRALQVHDIEQAALLFHEKLELIFSRCLVHVSY